MPKWVFGDRCNASHAFRQHIWDMGAPPTILPRRHEAPGACPDWIYNNRNEVERLSHAELGSRFCRATMARHTSGTTA